MNRRYLTWAVVLLAAFCWLIPAQAQDEETEGVADLVWITPKPGKGPDLEKAIRDYHLWVADKEGAFRYSWFAVETGSRTGDYVARSGDHNWADFDAEHDWDDEAGEKFAADVLPLIDSVERRLTVAMDEFSHWPDDFTGYTHYEVTLWYVKPGQYGNFRSGLEKIHKALTEGGYGEYYGFASTASGGKGNEISIVLPHKGYADMAENDPSFFDVVSEAVGGPEAFQALMEDFGTTYHIGHSHLVRYLPEASDYGDGE